MTIEEKAKAYDIALNKAKEWKSGLAGNGKLDSCLKDLFEELKESEDEKIRKAIKYGLEHVFTNNTTIYEVSKEQCLAWLEKQGEQKPEWSEEDEMIYQHCLTILHDYGYDNWFKLLRAQKQFGYNPYKEVVESIAEMCKHYDKASHSGLRDFYDNVKVKCKDAKEYDTMFPQKQWKPTEEQMEALQKTVDEHWNIDGDPLWELCEQLKAL